MRWTLGPVEAMLKTEEQISIIFARRVRHRADAGLGPHHRSGSSAGRWRCWRRPCATSRAATCRAAFPSRRVDEVGRLSQGFNRMLERLSQADAQIRAFNQRLAAEIEAATHDLSEKNATLAQLNRLLNDMRLDNASKVRLATLGQLAAQLAHEIGTPLSSVSGHIQLALLQRDLPPALRERLDVVGARDRAHQQDRARLPRFDAPARARARSPTALPRLLEEAVELVQGVAPGKRGAGRAAQVDPALGELVTDPGLLRQIVVNLLVERARRRRQATAASRSPRAPVGDDVLITVQRHRPRHPARRSAPHLRAVLHDQGARQGHRPRPGDLPPAAPRRWAAPSPSRAPRARARPSPSACRARVRPVRRQHGRPRAAAGGRA